ncbi:MAG: hypothetical protein ABSG68_25640 [Thermoguttaceae bacterium]|jgi:hypothetical protein
MSEDLSMPVNVLLNRLAPLVSQDAQLLAILRGLAQDFLRLTEPVLAQPSTPAPAEAVPGESVVVEPAVVPAAAPPQHIPLPSAPGIEIPVGLFRRLMVAGSDLQLIEARCRLKAEGARWAATRQRSLQDGANYYLEIEPRDREIINKAKTLDDCFLWMSHSSAPIPADLRLWEDVAGCFEAVAMATALVRQVIENGEEYRRFLEKTIDLAAEAQSSLRMAVEAVDGKSDSDQYKMFTWLRQTATEQQIFIARFMRMDDPANPTLWHDLQERIGQLDSDIEEIRQRDKQRVKTLKKAQYHARIIREGKGTVEDWKKVTEAVDVLVTEGLPPSNTDLRDMLVPIVDDIPDANGLREGFRRVLAEVDRYLATQMPPAEQAVREVSGEVQEVARLYKGKTLVVIGGDRRSHAYEALKSAFCLKELIWIVTREHESTEVFVPCLTRPDVDVVLLAIRWSSHSYGDVKALCDKFGKEFFRLPAGYNPNQVAHQILQQRSGGAA